jgi:hypothetical protein
MRCSPQVVRRRFSCPEYPALLAVCLSLLGVERVYPSAEVQCARTEVIRMNCDVISKRLESFRRSKNPWHILVALRLVMVQGRLFELMYGLICYLRYQPSRVFFDVSVQINSAIEIAEDEAKSLRSKKIQALKQLNSKLPTAQAFANCLIHGFAINDEFSVLGEYAEHSARIFVLKEGQAHHFAPYHDDAGVRHIHLVCLHKGSIFVATGDSNKYLDRFEYTALGLRHMSRIHQRLGGFTAACSVRGRLYLGTDFSSRPNYIYCLETKKKFFFPVLAFRQYCVMMLLINERHIVCLNFSLSHFEEKRTISIFDTRSEKFIYSEEYHGDSLITYHENLDNVR